MSGSLAQPPKLSVAKRRGHSVPLVEWRISSAFQPLQNTERVGYALHAAALLSRQSRSRGGTEVIGHPRQPEHASCRNVQVSSLIRDFHSLNG